ncbi:MAG: aminoacyl-tRNA hydrolase [Ruminococcaceae bacterium]|nr:aminoacyl-tRNA hydrolase [Oscillospiraceae bacterium]
MADIFDLFKKIETPKTPPMPVEYIIAGLGNVGAKYTRTRHNIGFMTLDYIAQKKGFKINNFKFKAMTADVNFGSKRVLFMKPETFMNNSGEAVREAADFYKIPPENIVIIFDDISLEPGKLRIRRKGSDGGHNGIKSIIYHLSSDAFPRIKMGVGAKPHPDYDLADWVLSEFSKEDAEAIYPRFQDACDALEMMLSGEIDKAMGKFNS